MRIGVHGYAWEVLPAYNMLRIHINNAIEKFSSNEYLVAEDPTSET
jgi:hypothetical protein